MIIIQSNEQRTIPHHWDCSSAYFGGIESAQKCRLSSYEEVQSAKLNSLLQYNLAVGSVEFMHEVFNQLNIPIPELPRNSNRKHENITLSEAITRTQKGEKLFIKPKQKKLFTGFVLDKSIYSCLHGLPENTEVLAYVPFSIDIESEWRFYICKNEIADIRNYSGDVCVFPSIDYVKNVIKENTDFPIAYTIDIGILESGNNVVIEYNDMYAIGNYGVRNDIYVNLLRKRYFEIIGKKSCF